MRKKILIIMSILLLGILLIGCEQTKKLPEMYIEIAELTEEELNILDIFGLKYDYEIYEYKVDENIKYREINLYEYKDGDWESIGGISGEVSKTTGRMLIYFNEDLTSFIVADQDEHGTNKYEMYLDKIDENLSKAGTHINEPTEIIYGEEIAIKAAIFTSQNEVYIMGLDYIFDETKNSELDKHDKVYAVTVLFDDEVHE